jgi:hypothetical protein
MRIRVDGRHGSESAVPSRFVLGDHTVEIDDLLDRWYGEAFDYFRVRGRDGHLYVLKHVHDDGRWELSSFTREGSCGTGVGDPGPHVLH